MKTEMKLNEYCEDCGYFDPIVETQILHANGKFFKRYITITCSYRLENMMWMTLLVYDYIIPGER
jgi:hypothetical protein